MNGFAGKILRVNLSLGSIQEETVDRDTLRKFIGGRGLGAKILFEELEPGIDPLGPDNKLIFLTGPASGTTLPGQTRWMVVGKSPLTGYFGEANCSGSFGSELKRAGFDAIVIEGKASSPVYLWVKDGRAEIRDASKIWGMMVGPADDALKADVGDPNAWVACIGPSGENMVKYAAVMSDKHRAAGRTGMGAVMGSKNLKAIVTRGTKLADVARPELMRKLVRELIERVQANPGQQGLGKYGTSGGIPTLNNQGILPTKNYQEGEFVNFDKISGEHMANTILTGTLRCQGCPVPHDRLVDMKESPYGPIDGQYGGAEYETIAAFGSLCLVDDLIAINKANEICNAYGVDTISAGNVLAWAMECYDKGLITDKDTAGIALKWGDAKGMLAMLEKLCQRDGFGDVLAEGVKGAAAKVGQGSEDFAIHVRGMEIAMHEPRGKKGVSLIYTAASPRGGSHMEAGHDPAFEADNVVPEVGITRGVSRFSTEDKGEIVKKASDIRAMLNDASICVMIMEPCTGRSSITNVAEVLSAITGWDLSVDELMEIGARSNTMARSFNCREGLTREDDQLPPRFAQAFASGGSQGQAISPADMDKMLSDFYTAAGWSANGIPTRATLTELGIGWVADALEGPAVRPVPGH
jgi:aldehyde:ferredoxin oxidoreductase